MSQSTTSGGGTFLRVRRASGAADPAALIILRIVARRSTACPRGVEIDFSLIRLLLRLGRRQQCLREPGRQLRLGLALAGARVHLGQQRRKHLFEEFRVAPEKVERLIEEREVLVPRNQHRRERSAEIVAIVETDRFDGR